MTDRPPLITPGRPLRPYVPDVTLNTLILGAAVFAAPFIPVFFDAQRQPKQYVPDAFVNATIGLQTPLVPFPRRRSISRPRGGNTSLTCWPIRSRWGPSLRRGSSPTPDITSRPSLKPASSRDALESARLWARRRHVSSLVNLKFAQLKDSHAARTYRFLAT